MPSVLYIPITSAELKTSESYQGFLLFVWAFFLFRLTDGNGFHDSLRLSFLDSRFRGNDKSDSLS
jgi:hypothetical protein